MMWCVPPGVVQVVRVQVLVLLLLLLLRQLT